MTAPMCVYTLKLAHTHSHTIYPYMLYERAQCELVFTLYCLVFISYFILHFELRNSEQKKNQKYKKKPEKNTFV